MAYWDTSALLKLYVPEPDSAYFLDLIAGSDQPIFSSSVAETEVLCALHRKEQAGDLKPGAAEKLFEKFLSDTSAGRIVTIPYGGDIVGEARQLVRKAYKQAPPLQIRSLDAIHIASALLSGRGVVVATDGRVREGAVLMGLTVKPYGAGKNHRPAQERA